MLFDVVHTFHAVTLHYKADQLQQHLLIATHTWSLGARLLVRRRVNRALVAMLDPVLPAVGECINVVCLDTARSGSRGGRPLGRGRWPHRSGSPRAPPTQRGPAALRHWVERPDADPAEDGTAGRGVGIIVGHPDDPEVATGPHLSTTTSTPRRRVA